jgi:hypothetical protein
MYLLTMMLHVPYSKEIDTIVMKFEGEDIVSDAEAYLDNKITPKF